MKTEYLTHCAKRITKRRFGHVSVSRLGLVVRRSAGTRAERTQARLPASAHLSLHDNCDLWTLPRDLICPAQLMKH